MSIKPKSIMGIKLSAFEVAVYLLCYLIKSKLKFYSSYLPALSGLRWLVRGNSFKAYPGQGGRRIALIPAARGTVIFTSPLVTANTHFCPSFRPPWRDNPSTLPWVSLRRVISRSGGQKYCKFGTESILRAVPVFFTLPAFSITH